MWPSSCCKTTSPIMPLTLGVTLVTVNLAMPHGTCSWATSGGPPVLHPWLIGMDVKLWPSSCCRTTNPMRHCKTDSYKHDSQRQRHDGTCSFSTAGGPPVLHPWLIGMSNCGPPAVAELQIP
ncbi:unnamed protein product [Staurois parvus]|uniref:Secreted protein n=1 Tax=Staurois parvus TaxID=386267 RepID=A0ABN9EL39_9NEOB|nr:unnamed protein product [Staurois parvus]